MKRIRPIAIVASLIVVAAACGGADPEPIATNDGAILISPPDVIAGDPEPTPDPVEAAAPALDTSELQDAPDVAFAYVDGASGTTADFDGKPTVLNFWASTCAACIAEMPEFEEVHQAIGDDVAFVGMNVADRREAAVELAAQTGVTYRLADDPNSEVFRSFQGWVMPTTVLLTADGKVGLVWSGVLTGNELRILIDEHIAPGTLDV